MADVEIETELKYRLGNWRDVHTLVDKLPAPEAQFTQTNFYLDDTKRSLREVRIMLRAREITFPVGLAKGLGKPPVTVTAKRRISAKDGLFVNEERTQVMHIDDWRDIQYGKAVLDSGPVLTWLGETVPKLGKLQVLGHTENHRWQIYSDVFKLEIDKTIYPDGAIEGEVECETSLPDLARAHIEKLLSGLNIQFKPATQGKYARFLEKAEGVTGYQE